MKKRILVVDDDQSILDLVQTYLNKHSDNYEVFMTSKSSEVLNLLNQKEIDILITDIIMPDINGVVLTQKVQDQFPSLKIIAMSAGGYMSKEAYLGLSKVSGSDYRLEKPFSKEELISAIEHVSKESEKSTL